MVWSTLLSSFALFVVIAQAAVDPNEPCLNGVCSIDIAVAAQIPESGTIVISGPRNSIADITPAAGWQILTCDPKSLSQDIRLVCTGDPTKCANLVSGGSSEGKIAHLPKTCGEGAFVRLGKTSVSADQSIPASVAATIQGGAKPQVTALHFDTNFAGTATSTKKSRRRSGPNRANQD